VVAASADQIEMSGAAFVPISLKAHGSLLVRVGGRHSIGCCQNSSALSTHSAAVRIFSARLVHLAEDGEGDAATIGIRIIVPDANSKISRLLSWSIVRAPVGFQGREWFLPPPHPFEMLQWLSPGDIIFTRIKSAIA
jgi:hypothetical protein